MSILPGEGTHLILYGSISIAARSQIHSGYLARPDLAGSHPTIVLVPDAEGITSGIKDLSRRIARYGLAVLAVDPYRGRGPNAAANAAEVAEVYSALSDSRVLADLDDVDRYLRGMGTDWADGESLGLFGLGVGGRLAVVSAVRSSARAIAVAYAPLIVEEGRSHQAAEVLATLDIPLLGMHGRADAEVEVDQALQARDLQPGAEWVLYAGGQHGFLDASAPHYDEGMTADAVERLVGFFQTRLAALPQATPASGPGEKA